MFMTLLLFIGITGGHVPRAISAVCSEENGVKLLESENILLIYCVS